MSNPDITLGETARRVGQLEAELEATRRVLAEALRAIVQASPVDGTKLRRGLEDMREGWGNDDIDDPVYEAASIFASELANEIER